MRFIIFAAIFILVMALMNLYIWRRFLRILSHDASRYLVVIPLLLLAGDIFFLLDIVTGFIPDSPALYMVSSSFVGITFMFFVIAVIYDLSISLSKRVPFDRQKRQSLKIIFDVTMLVMAASYLLRGLSQGVRFPAVKTVSVKIAGFTDEGVSIVQLSDVHVGRTIRRDFVEKLVQKTNSLRPDMVVITGDLFDLPVSQIEYDLYPLKQLDAPVFFILGNHEYFHGPGEAVSYLRQLGIRPLLNESVELMINRQRFNLVGLNDVIGSNTGLFPPDPDAAYQGVNQQLPCVVLAHQPRMIQQMGDYRCDLMLSGHTHGGQIFPFGLLVMAAQPYLAGLHQHLAQQQIYVSRGTGYWGPPLRFLAPSEITLLKIAPA